MNETTRALIGAVAYLLDHDQPDIALMLAQGAARLPDGPISTADTLALLAGLSRDFPNDTDVIYTAFTTSFTA